MPSLSQMRPKLASIRVRDTHLIAEKEVDWLSVCLQCLIDGSVRKGEWEEGERGDQRVCVCVSVCLSITSGRTLVAHLWCASSSLTELRCPLADTFSSSAASASAVNCFHYTVLLHTFTGHSVLSGISNITKWQCGGATLHLICISFTLTVCCLCCCCCCC